MTYKTDSKLYVEPEINILACILYNPKLIDELVISENEFENYGYVLSFFKKVYKKYHTIDIDIIFSVVKGTSLMTVMDVIDMLLDTIPTISNFKAYQKRVLERNMEVKELRDMERRVIDLGQDLVLGNIRLDEYVEKVNKWYENYNNISKNKLDDFEIFSMGDYDEN